MSALGVFGSFQKSVELVEQQNSGCILVTTKRHIALSPKYIGRVRTGVSEILDAELGRFSECLHGVLLAYGNIKLLQSSGTILGDSPFIHFDIKFDAVVFKPNIGSLLKCVVNEQASDHVGCLVHNWFNVSLLGSKKELNGKTQVRLEPGYWVLVQVERLHAKNGMLAIEARAPDDGTDLILESISCQNKTDSESNLCSSQQSTMPDTPDGSGPSSVRPVVETKRSGKKKKRKHSDVQEEETVDSYQPLVSGYQKKSEKNSHTRDATKREDDFSSSFASESKTEKETKPRKKNKHSKVEVTDLNSEPTVHETVPGTTWEETCPKKKKKNKNREETINLDSSQPLIKVEPESSKNKRQLDCGLASESQTLLDEPSSDEVFTKLKKKKRKSKESSLTLDSSKHQPFADYIKSSSTENTTPVKIKKKKQEHTVPKVNGNLPGSSSECRDDSGHSLPHDAVTESHKKRKRKEKEHNDSFVKESKKKKEKTE